MYDEPNLNLIFKIKLNIHFYNTCLLKISTQISLSVCLTTIINMMQFHGQKYIVNTTEKFQSFSVICRNKNYQNFLELIYNFLRFTHPPPSELRLEKLKFRRIFMQLKTLMDWLMKIKSEWNFQVDVKQQRRTFSRIYEVIDLPRSFFWLASGVGNNLPWNYE